MHDHPLRTIAANQFCIRPGDWLRRTMINCKRPFVTYGHKLMQVLKKRRFIVIHSTISHTKIGCLPLICYCIQSFQRLMMYKFSFPAHVHVECKLSKHMHHNILLISCTNSTSSRQNLLEICFIPFINHLFISSIIMFVS